VEASETACNRFQKEVKEDQRASKAENCTNASGAEPNSQKDK
jgi:hypothetical protein